MATTLIVKSLRSFCLLFSISAAIACGDGSGPSEPCRQLHVTVSSGPSPPFSWMPTYCSVVGLAVTHASQQVEVRDWGISFYERRSSFFSCPPYSPVTYGVIPAEDPGAFLHCFSETVPPRSLQLGSQYRVRVTTIIRTGWDDDQEDYAYAYPVSIGVLFPDDAV